MKRLTQAFCAALLAAGLGWFSGAASASTIGVASGNFDSPPSLFAAGAWANLDPAWSNGISPTQLLYYENNGDNMVPKSPDWSVYVANTGTITQDLSTTVNAGDTLSISFYGGNGASVQNGTAGGGLLSATFTVGATDYSTTFDTSTAPSGDWALFTLTKTIANSGDLKVSFGNVSGHSWLDNVSNVTVTPVPEPAACVLFGLGALGLCGVARRRRTRS